MDPERSETYFFTGSPRSGENCLEGKYASKRPVPEDTSAPDTDAVPLERFAGQYWWVEVSEGRNNLYEDKVLSTSEIANALDRGARVTASRGPFCSREVAEQRMEIYWEAIMGYDD